MTKFLALSKLKTFAYNKLYVAQDINFVFNGVKDILGKGENAVYQHFLLFPQCFQRGIISHCVIKG